MNARAITAAIRKPLVAADLTNVIVKVSTRNDHAPSWSPLRGQTAMVTTVETVTRATAERALDVLSRTYADVHLACGLNFFTVVVTQAA